MHGFSISPSCWQSCFSRLYPHTPLALNRLSTRLRQPGRSRIFAEKETESVEGSKESVRSTDQNQDPVSQTEAKDEDKVPIWVRREKMRELQSENKSPFELPFFVSLILSAVIAIAAVGSVFEFMNRNPVFGVIQPDSPFWLPLLAFFALTGLPVSGYFFFSAVASANKLADQMDEVDKA